MFSKSSLRVAVAVVACAFTLSLASHAEVSAGSKSARVLITQKIDETKLVTREGNVSPLAHSVKRDRGLVADDMPMPGMEVLMKRSPEQEAAFTKLMDQLHTPGSPNFHKWLTQEQINESFGLNHADVDKTVAWLEGHGFKITGVSPDGMWIVFDGNAGKVREAFHTDIHNFAVNGEMRYANVSDPKIPVALANAVVGPVQLHNFPLKSPLVPRSPVVAKDHTFVPVATPGGPAPDYTTSTPSYLFVPGDARIIYNVAPLTTAGYTGKGSTIGLIEDGNDYSDSDYASFVAAFFPSGLDGANATNLSTVHPSGSATCSNPGVNGADGEVELDIEYATAMAPAAKVVIESCADSSTYGTLYAAQNLAGQAAPPPVISMSYGIGETGSGSTLNAAYNVAFEELAAKGSTVFVSAGDQGPTTDDRSPDYGVHGNMPSGWSDSPYVTSVGGTDFYDGAQNTYTNYWNSTNGSDYSSAKGYIPEIPWDDTCASGIVLTYTGSSTGYGTSGFCNTNANFDTDIAGSGGASNCYSGSPDGNGDAGTGTCAGLAKPSYQTVFGNPADGVRDQPDLSLFASNGFWGHYLVVCYSDASGGGTSCGGAPSTWYGVGGTSASSPMMAGIQAVIDQYVGGTTTAAGQLQGAANYAYYALARAEYGASGSSTCNSDTIALTGSTCVFNDVTSGDIEVACKADGGTKYGCYLPSGTFGVSSTSTSSYASAYSSTSGWDFATGIGTVNAYNMAKAWASVAFTPVPTITGTVASYTYGATQTADTLTGAVSGPGSFPTGSVLFSYGISTNPVSGYASIGTDALVPQTGCTNGGTCVESVTQSFTPSATLTPGTYNVDTTYSVVNEDYTSGIVSATPVTFTVSKATPTAAISSATIGYENAFTLGATDTGVSGGAAPTGTVTFTVNGVTVTGTPICAGSGVVESCSESYTPPSTLTDGTYTITATFASDANYNASNTASGTLTVHMDNTTTTVTATPNSIASSGTTQLAATVKCSGTGSSVVGRMHGEVTASCTAVPTGTVTFTDTTNSASLGSCTLSAGTCTITGNGSAMAFGSNTITASYAAVTGEFNASSGTAAVTVTADVTSTSVTATPNTILATGSTMLAATVTDVTSSGTKPTGTVTFTDTTNSASLGSCTLSAGTCSATAQGSSMAAAGNTITASYAGVSGSFGASSGTTTVTVSALAASFGTMSFSPAASEPQGTSQAITISDTLTFNGAKPSGAVTFTLNSVGYTATCGATSPATCTATVPATTIAALAVNTYTVTAAVAAGGGYSATSGASGTFTITAVATSSITFSSVSHNFGQVAVGTAATAFGLTITNTSTTKAYPFSLVFTPANGFTSANNCGSSIAAGAHCQLDFYFTPTASGSVSATWSLAAETGFTYSPSNGGTLTGSGTTSGGVSLTSAGHNFGTVTVGQTSGAYGTELSNSTATAETISLGTVSAPFAMLTNCGTTLAAGSSCEIEFTFSPTTTSPVSVVVPLSGSPTAITSGGVALPSGGITLSGN